MHGLNGLQLCPGIVYDIVNIFLWPFAFVHLQTPMILKWICTSPLLMLFLFLKIAKGHGRGGEDSCHMSERHSGHTKMLGKHTLNT